VLKEMKKVTKKEIGLFFGVFVIAVVIACSGCIFGGGNSAKDMAEMVPEDAGLFAHYNIQTMRDDKDLDDAYESIEEMFDEIADFGIDIEDTNYMVDAGSIMIFRGKFDLEDVRDELDDADFDKDDYKDVELWLDESEAVAISKDNVIYGLKDNVKDCIKVMKGSEESVYEGDFKDVIDKLPDGIETRVKTSDFEYKDALAWGFVLMKGDEDTLLEQGVIKFDDEDDAEDAKSEVKRNLKTVLDDVEVTQNGEFLEYTGKRDTVMVIASWEGLIGGSGSVKEIAEITPEGTSSLTHVNLQAIRNDKELDEIYESIEGSESYELGGYGIDIGDLNYLAAADDITIHLGKFDLEDVRDELDDADFVKEEYKGVEFWLDGYDKAVAISGDKVIYGYKDDVRDCIKVIKGSEESVYEGDDDFRAVIDKLPGGIKTLVETSGLSSYSGAAAMGYVCSKEDEDTLEQNGEFLEFTGKMDIEDWDNVF
jgi:TATA-box binding protein (TBP) (component of TFIID and TFIIIB)